MKIKKIREKAFKIYPVALTTYNEEAIDINFESRKNWLKNKCKKIITL